MKRIDGDNFSSISIFVFGSFLIKRVINDVDLLIVYDEGIMDASSVINLKRELYDVIFKEFGLTADFITFTSSEAAVYKIAKRVRATQLI